MDNFGSAALVPYAAPIEKKESITPSFYGS